LGLTGIDDTLSANRVDLIEVTPFAPNTSNGRRVKYNIDLSAGGSDFICIANVTLNHFDALRLEFRIDASRQTSHVIATFDQLFNDVAAEESASAGDKCIHNSDSLVD
jgi:hypothetical protein